MAFHLVIMMDKQLDKMWDSWLVMQLDMQMVQWLGLQLGKKLDSSLD